MHVLNVITLFVALTLVGVELSVSAFVNPAAWRLAPDPQLQMLSRLALVLGKVMPVWYPVSTLLFGLDTWMNWHAAGRTVLLVASVLWALTAIGSIVFLVPLNTRITEGAAGWQAIHHTWDSRHRVRIAALAIAAALLASVLVR